MCCTLSKFVQTSLHLNNTNIMSDSTIFDRPVQRIKKSLTWNMSSFYMYLHKNNDDNTAHFCMLDFSWSLRKLKYSPTNAQVYYNLPIFLVKF